MKTIILFVFLFLFTALSCNKDKFQTKPTIEIKSLNTDEVGPGETLEINMEYTDKEGDLSNGILTYIRIRTNSTAIPNPAANDQVDTIFSPIPEFPVKTQGDISLNIPYSFMNEDPGRNDTMFFKITVKDIGNNTSDTVTTRSVVAKQN